MVAGRTTRLWIHLELLFQLQAQIFSGLHSKMRVVGNVGCSIIVEIVNFLIFFFLEYIDFALEDREV